jgi:cbb3-type cytochrome oxidase subunit 3
VIAAAGARNAPRKRGLLVSALFPPIEVRFGLALLLSFFPCGILYLLDYPAWSIFILACWVWVFPSPTGCLSLGLLPLVPSGACGYFAFNLFCLATTLGTASAAFRSSALRIETFLRMYRLARACIFLTLAICALQLFTGPEIWTAVFPQMSLAAGRAAGLSYEPSLLAGPITLYLLLLVGRIRAARVLGEPLGMRNRLLRNGVWVTLSLLFATRSISVLAVAIAFAPLFLSGRRRILVPAFAAGLGLVVAKFVLGERVGEAVETASGSIPDLITVAAHSWRNVPDLLIIFNFADFLLPGRPAEIRVKINAIAALMDPGFAWIQNTYSTFSAGGSTIGLLAVAGMFIGGLWIALRALSKSVAMSATWLTLYLVNWFLTPKYEAGGWVALGLLPVIFRLGPSRRVENPEASEGGPGPASCAA